MTTRAPAVVIGVLSLLTVLLVVGRSTATGPWVDTFNRSNRNLTGDTSSDTNFTWVDIVDAAKLQIISQKVGVADATDYYFEETNANLATVNHYAQLDCTPADVSSFNEWCDVVLRGDGAAKTAFSFGYRGGSVGSEVHIARFSAGGIASYTPFALTGGVANADVLTIYAEFSGGSAWTMTVKKNGGAAQTFTGTDSNLATPTRTGMMLRDGGGGGSVRADNFQTGDGSLLGGGNKAGPLTGDAILKGLVSPGGLVR